MPAHTIGAAVRLRDNPRIRLTNKRFYYTTEGARRPVHPEGHE